MAKVLFIGGSGEISFACVEQAAQAGHQVTVFNRGLRNEKFPAGIEQVIGELEDDEQYANLASRKFDTVCQFIAFAPETVARDIEVFSGHCEQYIFISTASAYRKSTSVEKITEATPLDNPFWEYSRKKAACENLLMQAHSKGALPVTIVRPSHTYRLRVPGTCFPGDHLTWRVLNDKPIIVHDDGESLWTLTHAHDFARAFVALFANEKALGEAFTITRDSAYTWNEIVAAVSVALNKPIRSVHVPTDVLIGYSAAWEGPLQGDKANSVVFDNQKVSAAVGGWQCEIELAEGLQGAVAHTANQISAGFTPNQQLDILLDRVINDQSSKS